MEPNESTEKDLNLLATYRSKISNDLNLSYQDLTILVLGQSLLGQEVWRQLLAIGIKQVKTYSTEENKTEEDIEQISGLIESCDLVVVTTLGKGTEYIWTINELCREKNKGFLFAWTLGLYGCIFVDFGEEFYIKDDGQETKEWIIDNIPNEKDPIVTINELTKHNFTNDTLVKFREVRGMAELNETQPISISVIDNEHFKLKLDTTNFGAYEKEGIVTKVNIPQKFKAYPLREALIKPSKASSNKSFIISDSFQPDRPENLHYALQGIFRFFEKNGKLPGNTDDDAKAVLDFAKEINEENKAVDGAFTIDEFDEQIFNNASRFSGESLSPVASFFGGVVAQEIVKFTGKYTPITQFLHLDFFKSLPRTEVNREVEGTRYENQVHVFGRELQEKLQNQKILLVGAGRLGCEVIRILAMMGIWWSNDGLLNIADDSVINPFDATTGSFFNEEDIGHPKWEIACKFGAGINPELNTKPYKVHLWSETENIITDELWESFDIVISAIESLKSNIYIQSKCEWYRKPHISLNSESETCNFTTLIPNLTHNYEYLNKKESVPLGTHKNFPYRTDHAVLWGEKMFISLFQINTQETIEFLNNLSKLSGYLVSSAQNMPQITINPLKFMKLTSLIEESIRKLIFLTYTFKDLVMNLATFPRDFLANMLNFQNNLVYTKLIQKINRGPYH